MSETPSNEFCQSWQSNLIAWLEEIYPKDAESKDIRSLRTNILEVFTPTKKELEILRQKLTPQNIIVDLTQHLDVERSIFLNQFLNEAIGRIIRKAWWNTLEYHSEIDDKTKERLSLELFDLLSKVMQPSPGSVQQNSIAEEDNPVWLNPILADAMKQIILSAQQKESNMDVMAHTVQIIQSLQSYIESVQQGHLEMDRTIWLIQFLGRAIQPKQITDGTQQEFFFFNDVFVWLNQFLNEAMYKIIGIPRPYQVVMNYDEFTEFDISNKLQFMRNSLLLMTIYRMREETMDSCSDPGYESNDSTVRDENTPIGTPPSTPPTNTPWGSPPLFL